MSDPELRLVLELATDEELLEFEEILYGTRSGPLLFVSMLFTTDSLRQLDWVVWIIAMGFMRRSLIC
jgi:hypothetical protein